jgi:hypothetical protein
MVLSSGLEMLLNVERFSGLVECEGDAGEFARQDYDRLGALQATLTQAQIHRLEHLAVGCGHGGVVEQATQQGWPAFRQTPSAAMLGGTAAGLFGIS